MNSRNVVIGGAVFAIAAVAVIVYMDNAQWGGSGSIELTGVPEGATIFIDNKEHSRVKNTPSVSLGDLPVGTHTIVVAKDGYWPWSKRLVVANKEELLVNAFVIPQEPQLTPLSTENDTYTDTLTSIEESKPPRAQNPLSSSDNLVEIWVEDDALLARWRAEDSPPPAFCITGSCEKTITVASLEKRVRDIGFLPEHNNVILFSAENGIFAIELDRRGTQNFQPLYLGVSPRFSITDERTLVILDEEKLFLLHF